MGSENKHIPQDYVINQYNSGRTYHSIADEFKCSIQAIYYIAKKHGIKTRHYGDYYGGKKLIRNTKRFQILNGYKIIYTPFHPFATKQGYVCEHRLVMEKYIKRFLRPDEVVHHKNENKLDNRPENLLLMNRSEHATHHLILRHENKRKLNGICT